MIQFAYPQWMWTLLVIPLLLGLIAVARRRRRQMLQRYCGALPSASLMDDDYPAGRRWKEALRIASISLIAVALIGPQVGQTLTEVKRQGVDLILAIDLSLSMHAEDVSPSRLRRAKFEVAKLLERLRGDRFGIVAFAGTSFLQCPLTLDYSAARLFLDTIDAGMIGAQGTALADAIATALAAFPNDTDHHPVLILVSDGEDHEGDLEAIIARARESGLIIYSVGVGTLSGAPIPLRSVDGQSQDFKRDRGGRVVTTALQERHLRLLAEQTGGRYYHLGSDAAVFEKIYNEISTLDKKEFRSHTYSDFRLRYQLFVGLAIALLIGHLLMPEKRPASVLARTREVHQ